MLGNVVERAKDLPGGRRLHVLVAIAYGKEVILTVPYEKCTEVSSLSLLGAISI